MSVLLTPAQRGQLARLRVNNPRARITVPARQYDRPLVRLRLYWGTREAASAGRTRGLTLWLTPDGRRLRSRP